MARYTKEFKTEVVGQVLERGYSVREVSKRLGVSPYSLYKWIKYDPRNPDSDAKTQEQHDLAFQDIVYLEQSAGYSWKQRAGVVILECRSYR